ncbi:F-box/kelch-repeat protein At3g23880-like [Papaver somniferum]|uniref:F-box/kelch-repeat protein At3g23880-like n=1 Tax=Papaver somniferum TaxID=3469 RepID=UPI000E6FC6A4|nr:F-box/kelch-repeat protein At3g23880-like [Papaver somniferum]
MQAEELELTLTATELEYSMRLATCNGLVCFYREYPVLMWNPVTKESIMLSKARIDEKVEFANACGFGYDAENNEYKAVQLLRRPSDSSLECMVLNIGTNMSWRRIQQQDNFLHQNLKDVDDSPESIFFEGSIYWWTYDDIVCFDVTADTFKMVPAPAAVEKSTRPHHLQPRHDDSTTSHMVELDNSLCSVELYICGGLMDIWMMKKDCVDMTNLWVKAYFIDLDPINFKRPPFHIRPFCVRGKKIYLNCRYGLACYDTETKEFEMVFTKEAHCYNYAVAYTKSTVCLKDIVGSKCVSTAHIGECEACRALCHIAPRI